MNKITFAVILPLLYLIGWCAVLEHHKSSGDIFRVRIGGYDPRDLIAGHYLQFQLNTAPQMPCRDYSATESACVCYANSSNAGVVEPYWSGDCSSRPDSCSRYIAGTCRYGRFETPITRYYIPENYSAVLSFTPPDSSVEIALESNGTPHLRGFFVGDKTLEEYAATAGRK